MAPPATDRPLARRPGVTVSAVGRLLGLAAALAGVSAASCKRAPPPLPPGSLLRLAFAQNRIAFVLAPGEQAHKDVRLAGRERDNATLAIAAVEGPATAELLPPGQEEDGSPLRAGVRLTFVAKQAGEGAGHVMVTTGLAPPTAPKQLPLYYTWSVGDQASGSRSPSSP
jgi:hypothetical protein